MKNFPCGTWGIGVWNHPARRSRPNNTQLERFISTNHLVGWPSWLWRQVKVNLNFQFLVEQSSWVQIPLLSFLFVLLLPPLSSTKLPLALGTSDLFTVYVVLLCHYKVYIIMGRICSIAEWGFILLCVC
jgi:hypothetical protein